MKIFQVVESGFYFRTDIKLKFYNLGYVTGKKFKKMKFSVKKSKKLSYKNEQFRFKIET